MEQKALSRALKAAVIFVGLILLFVYAFVLPSYGTSIVSHYPEYSNRYFPWLIFLIITALPCFYALILCWEIAGSVGRGRFFTRKNSSHIKCISILAACDCAYFLLGNIVLAALNMSHPGVLLFSLAFVFAGAAVSIAAMALSYFVKKAAALQEENDLTI